MNRPLAHDHRGAVFVEMTVVVTLFLLMLFGLVEFSLFYWQWNSAEKAAALGARLAATSAPVASSLKTLTGLTGSVNPGDPMPAFDIVCSGATASCRCASGTCGNSLSYTSAAMNSLVYGLGDTTRKCTIAGTSNPGMCDIYPPIKAANVRIEYVQTGLGFAGRPGGPVPTINLRLSDLPFSYHFLRILGLTLGHLPPISVTVTGEDLSNSPPA